MSEAFIVRRGGSGSGKSFAIIHVDYPAGSVCTCTNGTKTLKAKDTTGAWNFPIPEAGTWTVECHTEGNSKSRTVEITTQGQFEEITLAYEQNIEFSVYTSKSANAGTYDASNYKDATETFSTVGFTTLVVTYKTGGYSTVGGANASIALCDASNAALASSGNLAYHNDGATWECDISAIDVETAHIRVRVNASGGPNGYTFVSITATNVLLK